MFYPQSRDELSAVVEAMLAAASPPGQRRGSPPKALIVPHAGYVYSGPIAAHAYALLLNARTTVKRVVLLGPVHRVPIRGLALPAAEALASPLGVVPIDRDGAQLALTLPQVHRSEAAHAMEHSLEVQLPFLQIVLEDFCIVPLAVGDATVEEVAQVIAV